MHSVGVLHVLSVAVELVAAREEYWSQCKVWLTQPMKGWSVLILSYQPPPLLLAWRGRALSFSDISLLV